MIIKIILIHQKSKVHIFCYEQVYLIENLTSKMDWAWKAKKIRIQLIYYKANSYLQTKH